MINSDCRFNELDILLSKLCSETIEEDEVEHLNSLLAADSEARQRYSVFVFIHGAMSWQPNLAEELPMPAEKHLVSIVSDAMIESSNSKVVDTVLSKSRRKYVFGMATAAAIVLLLVGFVFFQNKDAQNIDASAVRTVDSGMLEVKLDNGVDLLFEGPARFRIASPMKIWLYLGKLAASVPQNAHGFSVVTPTARIVDLGTEFGVEVRSDNSTFTEVFFGRVSVGALNSPTSLELMRGKSATVFVGAAVAISSPHFSENFARDVSRKRHAIPIFSTGENLRVHGRDPHWQIVKEDFNASFEPQDAFVHESANPRWPVNAMTIGLAPAEYDDPPGVYTFETTFDLTGFDPSTVEIHARIYADDGLDDIVINGKSTGKNLPITKGARATGDFTLRDGFQKGMNKVEFLVRNRVPPNTNLNPVAVIVDWEGMAVRN